MKTLAFPMSELDAMIFSCCCSENRAILSICHSKLNRAWISSTSFMTGSLTGRVFSIRAWDTSLVQKMEETQITTWPGHCKTHWLRGTWKGVWGGQVVGSFHLVWLKSMSEKHPPPPYTLKKYKILLHPQKLLGLTSLGLLIYVFLTEFYEKEKKIISKLNSFFFLKFPIQEFYTVIIKELFSEFSYPFFLMSI